MPSGWRPICWPACRATGWPRRPPRTARVFCIRTRSPVGWARSTIRLLLRDFDTARLAGQAQFLRTAAAGAAANFPGAKINVEIKPQYRNMAAGLTREPRAVAYARRALEGLGRTLRQTIVRGGTDGSRLTELGLPTPNLSCGAHTPHSVLEWACLEEMIHSAQWLVALAQTWGTSGEGRWARGEG